MKPYKIIIPALFAAMTVSATPSYSKIVPTTGLESRIYQANQVSLDKSDNLDYLTLRSKMNLKYSLAQLMNESNSEMGDGSFGGEGSGDEGEGFGEGTIESIIYCPEANAPARD